MDIASQIDIFGRPGSIWYLSLPFLPAFLEVEMGTVKVLALLICHIVKIDNNILNKGSKIIR